MPYGFANSNSPLDSRVDLGFSAKISKYVNLNYTLISIFDKDLSSPGLNAWQKQLDSRVRILIQVIEKNKKAKSPLS